MKLMSRWLDLHTPSCVDNVHTVMAERINTAKDKKCDAVDPDNVDSYNNNVGWGTTGRYPKRAHT